MKKEKDSYFLIVNKQTEWETKKSHSLRLLIFWVTLALSLTTPQ
jgi:hypothetical protein